MLICNRNPVKVSNPDFMKRSLFSVLFLIPAVLCSLGNAQTDSTLFNSTAELIQRANELHDNGNYAEAIALLNKVSICDDAYPWSCYEQALNYYYSGNNEGALNKCKEAEFLHYDHPYLFSSCKIRY